MYIHQYNNNVPQKWDTQYQPELWRFWLIFNYKINIYCYLEICLLVRFNKQLLCYKELLCVHRAMWKTSEKDWWVWRVPRSLTLYNVRKENGFQRRIAALKLPCNACKRQDGIPKHFKRFLKEENYENYLDSENSMKE